MRKDSIIIGFTSVLITAAVVGGLYYQSIVRQPGNSAEGQQFKAKPSSSWPNPSATGNPGVSPAPSNRPSTTRTNTPIKCHNPEVGEFWTNAATCEGADLHNRLSIAQPISVAPNRPDFDNRNYAEPGENIDRSRTRTRTSQQNAAKKPNLRLAGKSPPSGLSPECKFPVGKALEIERVLSAADDPKESKWRGDYCKWRKEARGCDVPNDLYYYRSLCSTW